MSESKQNIYTIPPTVSFVDTLARGLLDEVGDNREKLPHYLILLPTRRACRSLREAFLRKTGGEPILLPRMQAIGDVDSEELSLTAQDAIDILPAISSIERQVLLAKIISKLPNISKGPSRDMALARALGQLMDQIHTEDLALSDLPQLVDREKFADHWQITVDFLGILSEYWPAILKEKGMIDAADRRNKLINALNQHWQKTPPDTPVIAAGTTGSIPSTAALLKTIASLPHGSVILPGLDQNMSCKAWEEIEEGHPQATLKQLLGDLACNREDVKKWPYVETVSDLQRARENLVSMMMVPADSADLWTEDFPSNDEKKNTIQTLEKVKSYDCQTPQEEAELIGVLLRETLEEKDKTCALITPDRNLARRVMTVCQRWNISIDDSAGCSLLSTSLGTYLMSCAHCCASSLRPSLFLSFLKHDLNTGAGFQNYRTAVRLLDERLLRGVLLQTGFDAYQRQYEKLTCDDHCRKKPDESSADLLNHLKPLLSPLTDVLSEGYHEFSELLKIHIDTAERMAASEPSAPSLWQNEAGEKAVKLLNEINSYAKNLPRVNGQEYIEILTDFLRAESVRPLFGTHPRLQILGQLEARMVQADRVILAGLNEGTWPANPENDPWMSRPMRSDFGLPTPERSITLSAHDFSQAFCNKEVFLTRSRRVDRTPTVPARWLQRLDTFLAANDIKPDILKNGPHLKYLEFMNQVDAVTPIDRPAPTPPVESRPSRLSVTKIENWIKDPYSIYAGKILRLNKLDPLEKEPDAADKGSLLHEILQRYVEKYKGSIPTTGESDFISIATSTIEEKSGDDPQWNFWVPRLMRLAESYVSHEREWRNQARFMKAEAEGSITIKDGLNSSFQLECRADRLDKVENGGIAIIDYKSGGTYSMTKMQSGELPQLPMEALILSKKGFADSGINETVTSNIGYWTLTGGSTPVKITQIDDEDKLKTIIQGTEDGLLSLLQAFEKQETPYYALPRPDNAPRFNDYEYLERAKEWTALGENSEEAA